MVTGAGGNGPNKTKILRNDWGSDEDLMGEDHGLGHSGSVEAVKGKGMGFAIALQEFETPQVPPRSKFPEIRVASTWEVQVDDVGSHSNGMGR